MPKHSRVFHLTALRLLLLRWRGVFDRGVFANAEIQCEESISGNFRPNLANYKMCIGNWALIEGWVPMTTHGCAAGRRTEVLS